MPPIPESSIYTSYSPGTASADASLLTPGCTSLLLNKRLTLLPLGFPVQALTMNCGCIPRDLVPLVQLVAD